MPVIPSEVEGSRRETFKDFYGIPRLSLGMTDIFMLNH
jgi:hypothetical protein